MKKLTSLILVILLAMAGLACAAAEGRDWSAVMPMPTEEQLSRPGECRSPYVTFFADTGDITGLEMNLRIDHDPLGTYICPACWFLNVSSLEEKYTEVYSDYSDSIGGYLGFQVLETGEKVLIMSLWNVFCRDADGKITELKPKVLYSPEARIREHTPETNGEGSFLQCIIPCDWKTEKDYRLVLVQETGEEGTEVFTLSLMEAKKALLLAQSAPDISASKPILRINAFSGKEEVAACGEALMDLVMRSTELIETIVRTDRHLPGRRLRCSATQRVCLTLYMRIISMGRAMPGSLASICCVPITCGFQETGMTRLTH